MTAPDGLSRVDAAAVWLRTYLDQRGGTARAADILAAAAVAGHNGRACRRACPGIGVTITRAGFGKGSAWTLPAVPNGLPAVPSAGGVVPNGTRSRRRAALPGNGVDDATPDAEPTPPKTWRVPGRRDIYGNVTEYHQVSSPEAAGHWDERQWERIG